MAAELVAGSPQLQLISLYGQRAGSLMCLWQNQGSPGSPTVTGDRWPELGQWEEGEENDLSHPRGMGGRG